MAKKTASISVDPFAAATKKPTSSAKKSDVPIYVASDLKDSLGNLIFSKTDICNAIDNYIEGHNLFEQGKAMKDSSRPVALAFARQSFAENWVMQGYRPKNPKIQTEEDGKGNQLGVIFQDSVSNLDENSYAQLVSCIGKANAEENVTQGNEFTINSELLDEVVEVSDNNGGTKQQTVMAAMIEALQQKFAPSPEILKNLFSAKPIFETKKGLIDRGLKYVTNGKTSKDIARLVDFMQVGKFTTQLKIGATE